MREFAAKEIGGRVAQARREAGGMTQEQLAELLDVSTRAVQNYEGGITIPWKHFKRLEQIFDKDLAWFLHGTEAPDDDLAEMVSGILKIVEDDVLIRLGAVQSAVEALDRKFDQLRIEERFVAVEELLREIRRERV